MKIFLIVFQLLVFLGCAYPQKKGSFEKSSMIAGQSRIYLYRLPTEIDSLNGDVPRFYVNDSEVGKLLVGGYYEINISPGNLNLYYKESLFGIPFFWKSRELIFEVKANEIYFVRFGINGIFRIYEFTQVRPEIGFEEIKKTVLLDSENSKILNPQAFP